MTKRQTKKTLGIPFIPAELELLLDRICQANNLHKSDLRGKSKDRSIVQIRRQFAQAARHQNYSYPNIGAALHRHHTTVMSLLGVV